MAKVKMFYTVKVRQSQVGNGTVFAARWCESVYVFVGQLDGRMNVFHICGCQSGLHTFSLL